MNRAGELKVGMRAEYERDITEATIQAYASSSGDQNPLHVDMAYAKETKFGARIAHGAFQVGLASALIGMHLPGTKVLLGSIVAKFPLPLYYPTRVRVSGELVSWNATTGGGMVRVEVVDLQQAQVTAEIQMAFVLHESETRGRPASPEIPPQSKGEKPLILVTGSSGGVGLGLVDGLRKDFEVLALGRENSRSEHFSVNAVNLLGEQLEDQVAALIERRNVFGIIHAAWPGMPRGGLLNTSREAMEGQFVFGTTVVIRLAKLLFNTVAEGTGGRLITIGSVAGQSKPTANFGAYSLAKASLEQTVRLLAPELALRRITINSICPSLIPVGLNRRLSEKQILVETAKTPAGRLCQTNDVTGLARFLLSPQAEFISGQNIQLSGGQL